MDFEDIERILELMKQHELAEFELDKEGLKLRVRKANTGSSPMGAPVHAAQVSPTYTPPPAPAPSPVSPALDVPGDRDDSPVELAVVKSPIVGTFYRSPEPGASSFVEIGDRVKKDQVLCIIEAMKLMNEITSEYEGEIVNVYVENGKPVQYGERLFAIRTA
jgi:acetyl-CoA carboxylase biotin carboxyl carrier protein